MMPRDLPISFVAPMIRALWDGWKTQTRRVLQKPKWAQDQGWPDKIMDEMELDGSLIWYHKATGCATRLPLYAPGDRLWVREDWKVSHALDDCKPRDLLEGGPGVLYMATDGDGGSIYGRRRWSNHMPRWASRMTLTVTDVRVQRVQEITNADAVAEGIERLHEPNGFRDYLTDDPTARVAVGRPSFRTLWDSLNKERGHGWDVNPWVAAYTFTVEKRNIDA